MKRNIFIRVMSIGLMLVATIANAQTGYLKNAGEKISGNKKNNSETPTQKEVHMNNENNAVSNTLEPGKAYFYTGFKATEYKKDVNVGDELFVRFELGKTMIELGQEKGLEVSSWAYGYLTIYIDGSKVFVTKPWSFASNISKDWTYINIPLNVSPEFISKLESDQSMLETAQDIWVFQQLFQENSVVKKYTEAAMSQLTTGSHVVKAEFGLSSSDSEKEPQAVICSGEVNISADAAGANALAMNGPKHLRPLSEDEKGVFKPSATSFAIGSGELNVKLSLPHAPKYYNMKWC